MILSIAFVSRVVDLVYGSRIYPARLIPRQNLGPLDLSGLGLQGLDLSSLGLSGLDLSGLGISGVDLLPSGLASSGLSNSGLTGPLGISKEMFCGLHPVDCGNGWCCMGGQQCITAVTGKPACRGDILTDIGGGPMTLDAAPFSTIIAQVTSIASELSSYTITLSAASPSIPGGTAALPTYPIPDDVTTIPKPADSLQSAAPIPENIPDPTPVSTQSSQESKGFPGNSRSSRPNQTRGSTHVVTQTATISLDLTTFVTEMISTIDEPTSNFSDKLSSTSSSRTKNAATGSSHRGSETFLLCVGCVAVILLGLIPV